MPKRIGNARVLTDIKLGMRLKMHILGEVAAQPQMACTVGVSLVESATELERLRGRASQAWPEEYNRKEVEIGLNVMFPHIFEATFAVKPEEADVLLRDLHIPASMVVGHRKRAAGRTALLVFLARLRTGQSLESLGLILHMNPKRISEICTTMVGFCFVDGGTSRHNCIHLRTGCQAMRLQFGGAPAYKVWRSLVFLIAPSGL